MTKRRPLRLWKLYCSLCGCYHDVDYTNKKDAVNDSYSQDCDYCCETDEGDAAMMEVIEFSEHRKPTKRKGAK